MGRYTISLVDGSNYQHIIDRLEPGMPIKLSADPENPQDPRAVKATSKGETIGYVERDSWLIRALHDDRTPVASRVDQITGGEMGEMKGVVLDVRTGVDAEEALDRSQAATTALEGKKSGGAKSSVGKGCMVMIGVLLVLGIIGGLMGDPPKNEVNALDAEVGVIESDGKIAVPNGVLAEEKAESKWSYYENTDELRGGTSYRALLRSENSQDFDFPYGSGQYLTITVRKSTAYGSDVFFEIDKGQMICGIYDCRGMISFDGKAEGLTLVPPEDHDTEILFAKYGEAIIKKLKNSDKVIVEIQFYQEGNRQFIFDTRNLEWKH